MLRLQHPPRAGFAAGLIAEPGTENRDTACSELRDIGAGRGIRPHHTVHRRRNVDRRFRGETQGREEIVRHAGGKASEKVGTGRRNDDLVGPAREFDMPHRGLGACVPDTGSHRRTGDRLKSEGRNELLGAGGHHHPDLGTARAQPAHQVRRFVRCDATSDAEQYLDGFCLGHSLPPQFERSSRIARRKPPKLGLSRDFPRPKMRRQHRSTA